MGGSPMTDADGTFLRELAHRYYSGELDYASYRHARTELLDQLTRAVDDLDSEITRPMPKKSRARRDSTRRRRLVWVLIVISVIMVSALSAMIYGSIKLAAVESEYSDMTSSIKTQISTGNNIGQ